MDLEEIRTLNLWSAKPALYRWSYRPMAPKYSLTRTSSRPWTIADIGDYVYNA